MKIYSFIRDHFGLKTVEVEVSFVSGLPKIQFLGLPDAIIKESVHRIQSAFKVSGYTMPKNKQVMIHLKPSHLKKNSRGLDLAVAAAILWESEQIPRPDKDEVYLYGEVSLKGEVLVPDDMPDVLDLVKKQTLITGKTNFNFPFVTCQIQNLKEIQNPQFVSASESHIQYKRPLLPNLKISNEQARIIQIVSVGEHPTLFAGPPGTGKSTLAQLSSWCLQNPSPKTFRMSQKIARHFGQDLNWRPLVSPHHSATPLSMIGGGLFPQPGNITRAHGGALIMDEFLEFDPKVSEALREPLESGSVTISRAGNVAQFPAKFLLLATTNLCPCGHLIPDKNFDCKGRARFCFSSLHKLSGPMLDRFTILSFSHEWNIKSQTVKLEDLFKNIQEIQKFKIKTRNQNIPNQDLSIDWLEENTLDIQKLLPDFTGSFRRKNSFLKVLRTIADCDLSEKIKSKHIDEAYNLSQKSFKRIESLIH